MYNEFNEKPHCNKSRFGGFNMSRSQFLISGNIIGARVKLGRALHQPPLTQNELARKIQLMGMDMTALIISRIEKTSGMSVMPNFVCWQKHWASPWSGCVGTITK